MSIKGDGYVISREESERIDILKIWFLFMIIFIHSNTSEVHYSGGGVYYQVPIWLDWVKYLISEIVSRCAVPGYFFISAVLLYKKEFTWEENAKKKIRTIMVPYLIINTAWILIFYIAQHIPFLTIYFSQDAHIISNWGISDYLGAYLDFRTHPFVYPLWFLRSLMVLNLLAPVMKWIIDRFPKAVFAALIAMLLLQVQTHLPFLKTTDLIYFCLGYYFVKYSIRFSDIDKLKYSYIIMYLVSLVLCCLTRGTKMNYLPHYASIFFGFLFFFRFTTKIPAGKAQGILMFASRYSFPIYLFHELNLTFMKKLLGRVFPQTAFCQLFLYIALPFALYCLCLILCVILDRYFHKIYLVLSGYRAR